MKLGIVGSGMIVKDFLSFIHEVKGIELQAIASTAKSYNIVQELARNNNIKKAYEEYDELLLDSGIDTIYLGIPNHLHYAFAKKALEKGKNVICEKPFTSNYNELKELVELAKVKELFLLEAISTVHLPNTLKIKEILNEIGDIKIVVANYSQRSSRYDAFKNGEILPAFDYKKSGGALMDLNIYNIHLMSTLFGEPLSVKYQANIENNIDTSGIITLDYKGFKAVLIGAKDCKAPISTCIQGDKGCINISTPANVLKSFKLLRNDGSEESFNLQGEKHRMYYEFVEFERIISEKDYEQAQKNLQESLIAMKVATMARESAGIVFPADKESLEVTM